jgi:hypothetical protein
VTALSFSAVFLHFLVVGSGLLKLLPRISAGLTQMFSKQVFESPQSLSFNTTPKHLPARGEFVAILCLDDIQIDGAPHPDSPASFSSAQQVNFLLA